MALAVSFGPEAEEVFAVVIYFSGDGGPPGWLRATPDIPMKMKTIMTSYLFTGAGKKPQKWIDSVRRSRAKKC